MLQETYLQMLLGVPTMSHRKCCVNVMVRRLMFGVLGWSYIFCWVGFLPFGMVRIVHHWIFFCFYLFPFYWPLEFEIQSFLTRLISSDTESEQGIFEQVLRGDLDFVSDPWPSISESAKDLIRKMLVRDAKKRLTAHEVLCKLSSFFCGTFLVLNYFFNLSPKDCFPGARPVYLFTIWLWSSNYYKISFSWHGINFLLNM